MLMVVLSHRKRVAPPHACSWGIRQGDKTGHDPGHTGIHAMHDAVAQDMEFHACPRCPDDPLCSLYDIKCITQGQA
jgi:hypothetical protein